jgi:hypothetical protein
MGEGLGGGAEQAAEKPSQDVIASADFMILRLTTVHENARRALECGGLTPPWSAQGTEARGEGGVPPRRAAFQGAFGTVIFMASRTLALP